MLAICPVNFAEEIEEVAQETGSSLTVEVDGFASDEGKVMIALVDSKENYESDKPFKGVFAPIKNKTARYVFENLEPGEYAVKLYHDKNDNDELDTNFAGIPKEAYGFSRNARGTFGPPTYEKAAFTLNSTTTTIRITVK